MLDLNLFSNPGQYYIFSDDFRPGKEQRSEKAFRDFWIKHVRKDLDFDDQYKFYSLKDTGITNMLRANTDIISVRGPGTALVNIDNRHIYAPRISRRQIN
jgi:hypothetical protein